MVSLCHTRYNRADPADTKWSAEPLISPKALATIHECSRQPLAATSATAHTNPGR